MPCAQTTALRAQLISPERRWAASGAGRGSGAAAPSPPCNPHTLLRFSSASGFRGLRGVCCGSFLHLLSQVQAISLRAAQCHQLTVVEKDTGPMPGKC